MEHGRAAAGAEAGPAGAAVAADSLQADARGQRGCPPDCRPASLCAPVFVSPLPAVTVFECCKITCTHCLESGGEFCLCQHRDIAELPWLLSCSQHGCCRQSIKHELLAISQTGRATLQRLPVRVSCTSHTFPGPTLPYQTLFPIHVEAQLFF